MPRIFILFLIIVVALAGCSEENPVRPNDQATTDPVSGDVSRETLAVADVAITAFGVSSSTVMPGDVLDLSATVANLGNANASSFTVKILEKGSGIALVTRTVPGLGSGLDVSGSVPFTIPAKDFSAKVAPGLYTLVCVHDFLDVNPVNDWIELQVLVGPSTGESIGIYFDTSGTGDPLTSCEPVNMLDHAYAAIVWKNPSLPATAGFGCGWDLSGSSSFSSSWVITLATSGLNIGINDPFEGTFNIISGFHTPLPTTVQTILAYIDVFYLDGTVVGQPGDAIDLTLRNSIPEDIPGDGRPTVVSPGDFIVYPINMPYSPGSPSLQFNPVVCEVEFAKASGWEGVKKLFR